MLALRRVRWASSIVFVAAFVGVTGTAAGSAETPAESAEATSMTETSVRDAGVSLRYPSGWTVMPRTSEELAAQQERLARSNPALAERLAQAARLDEQPPTLELRVIDLASQAAGSSGSNVRVYVHASPRFPSSLDEFTARWNRVVAVAKASGTPVGTTLRISTLEIDGKRSYRLDVRRSVTAADGTVVPIRWARLSVPRGRGDVAIDVTTSDDAAGEELIDEILASVHRL